MGDVTPNIKLNVPDFDQDPWDQDVNTNWAILDATVGLYTAIPNLTGVWKNNTAYSYGQSAIDPTDSSIWTCAQAHTSTSTPTTFPQERSMYPARWSATTPGAMFYASQAANSAAAAAASAAAAAASAAQIGIALPISGGTMTGVLTLHADPVNVLEAVTKQYVDARVGGVGFLPLTGGTLTGALVAGGSGIAYSTITAANRHYFSFGWDGQMYAAVNGTNIGYLASQSYVSGGYLPLGGGNLTGTLYAAGELQAAAVVRISNTNTYMYGYSSGVDFQMDSSGYHLHYERATGALSYFRSDGFELLRIDGGGNVTVGSNLVAPGNAVFGNVYAHSGNVYIGAGNRTHLSSDNSTYTHLAMLDNYGWFLNWSSGMVGWMRYDGVQVFTIDVSGNINMSGAISCGNINTNAGSINTVNLSASNNVLANGTISAMGGSLWIGAGGNGRAINMASSWYFDWNAGNGDMGWNTPSGCLWIMAASIGKSLNQVGPVGGQGPYENYSDIRGKEDIKPARYGLGEVLQLRPIEFTRIINHKREVGFSAQDVREIIPHAVQEMGIDPDSGMLSMCIDPIVAALVNGMQELSSRIIALESRQ